MEKGIKHDSALNELNYFHVTNPGLPPCAVHDLFEGIVQSDMWLAIRYFVQQRWFRIGLLNFRLKDIRLSIEGALFIPDIKISGPGVSKKLTGTASQMRRLVLIFPIAIADMVKNFDDPVWLMIMHLRSICDLVCAPALSMGQIAKLRMEIDHYLLLRKECFPIVQLLPEHEFLMHYPTLTEYFGPLKHLWTLRFESKHGDFKKDVKHKQNFKNLTQRLAEKHQLKQAAYPFAHDVYAVTDSAVKYVTQEHDDVSNLAIISCFVDCDKFITDKVLFRGIQYKKDMTICIGKNEYGNFLVCKITSIIINADYMDITFVGIVREIILIKSLGVYEINNNESNQSVSSSFPYSSLLSPDPLPELTIISTPVFITKYALFDPDLQD